MAQNLESLMHTISTLRAPGGCPWDRKQTLAHAAHYLLEEAGELLDAALTDDLDSVREELGDLLFMLCFCVEILSERCSVSLADIAREGNAKLIRRHPHVFGDRPARDSGESQERWNEIKAAEKRARGVDPDRESLLKDLPSSSAPLHQAFAYQTDAAGVGFDWPEVEQVWDKVAEELAELREAAELPATSDLPEATDGDSAPGHTDSVEHEVGDLLFAVVNLARWFGVLPELALRRANHRFRWRFHSVEQQFGGSREQLQAASLDQLEAAWEAAKRLERDGHGHRS